MIRLVLAGIYAFLAVVLSAPVHLYFWILKKKDQQKAWYKSWKYVRGFFKGLLFIAGTKVEVRGAENLPKEGPILIIGNHRSFFDIIVLQTLLGRPMGFVAKDSLGKVPMFNWYMNDIGCVYLNRGNVREGLKTINTATENMTKGLSYGLFPEGHRSTDNQLLPFKAGGYRIAEKSESAMVVTALSGTEKVFEGNKHKFIKKAKVIVEFDKPVYPHELEKQTRKEFYDNIPNRISEILNTH